MDLGRYSKRLCAIAVVILITGCSGNKMVLSKPSSPPLAPNPQHTYPALIASVIQPLKQSGIPVYLPDILPVLQDKGNIVDIHIDQIQPNSYQFTLFQNTKGNSGNPAVADGSLLATFEGTTDVEAARTTYYDRIKSNLSRQENMTLDGHGVTHYMDEHYPKAVGSDLIMWQEKPWTVIASGSPFVSSDSGKLWPDYSTQGIAQYVMKNFDFSGKPSGVESGYIQGTALGSRSSLKIAWTFDGNTWYSVDGYQWDYIIQLLPHMKEY